jgi:hypothetical protein
MRQKLVSRTSACRAALDDLDPRLVRVGVAVERPRVDVAVAA